MSNKELVEIAKQVIEDLRGTYGTKTACDCLRLFCERIEQTKELQEVITNIQAIANENLSDGQGENDANWGYQEGVIITNKQALDIAKFVPLYRD